MIDNFEHWYWYPSLWTPTTNDIWLSHHDYTTWLPGRTGLLELSTYLIVKIIIIAKYLDQWIIVVTLVMVEDRLGNSILWWLTWTFKFKVQPWIAMINNNSFNKWFLIMMNLPIVAGRKIRTHDSLAQCLTEFTARALLLYRGREITLSRHPTPPDIKGYLA